MVAYSFKRRFVDPIRVGLNQLCEAQLTGVHPKCQTIRAMGKRRHARAGETIQLYTAMRTKQCRKIGDARCVSVHDVSIMVGKHTMPIRLDGAHLGGGHIHDFARADGFASGEDMLAFWQAEHGLGKFDGVLIRWEPE
jgi:hypothetical protein